jgi:hypothetical protein
MKIMKTLNKYFFESISKYGKDYGRRMFNDTDTATRKHLRLHLSTDKQGLERAM